MPNTLAASSNTSGASKLAFHGLKASKLESVAQAVCTSRKPSDPTSTLSPPSASAQKPSFIPLAKEQSIPTCGSTAAAAVLDSSVTASAIAKEASAKPVVEAVVAAPTTPKVEAKFVFGENLTDRVANFENVSSNGSTKVSEVINTAAVAAAPSTELSVESPEKEKTKTLTESAAEYVESRSKKVDFSDVELITGEENEVNAFQMSAKVVYRRVQSSFEPAFFTHSATFQLYIFEKTTSSWLERGRGQIRLNDQRAAQHDADDNPILSSRLIMRTAGSLRVILNSKVFAGMTLEKPTDKNIRLTATDGVRFNFECLSSDDFLINLPCRTKASKSSL